MTKYVLVPDSFKGTMSSLEVCEVMRTSILLAQPEAIVKALPVADGGEGSVDAFLAALGGNKIYADVKGPLWEPVHAFFGVLPDGTAVIEMAAAAGLPLVHNRLDPLHATTYGVGELIRIAIEHGHKRIIVGLGGSATNDLGCGAAAALGVVFRDAEGSVFIPVGGNLDRISHIDISSLDEKVQDCEITCMCDIDNPLYGTNGAAYIFGPQKGADFETVVLLDDQLRAAARVIQSDLGLDISDLPGAGAAGGMGGGLAAFLGATLRPGIETVLDVTGFDLLLDDTSMVFTGEGRLDIQTLGGKVIIGVAHRAKRHHVPVVAIVGDIGDQIEKVYDEGVSAVFSTNRVARDFELVKNRARSDLQLTMDNLMRFINLMPYSS